MYRLIWDVNADAEKLFAEYYRDLFGPAAAEIRAFDTIIHNAYISCPQATRSRMYIKDGAFLTEPVLRSMRVAFNRAKKAGAGDAKVAARLAFFEKGLEVAELWCRAQHDLRAAQQIGSLVLARRALAGLREIRRLFQRPGYRDGFDMGSYWGPVFQKAVRRYEAAVRKLEGRGNQKGT